MYCRSEVLRGYKEMQSTKTKIESHPVPTQLATMTDLSKEETKSITDAVNPLIADAFALYVKTKNFYWHLYGSHFKDYHELLGEHAEAILESTDIMAERVRRVGCTTIRLIMKTLVLDHVLLSSLLILVR
jgi:starvation-inducible DNA-binding protein